MTKEQDDAIGQEIIHFAAALGAVVAISVLVELLGKTGKGKA